MNQLEIDFSRIHGCPFSDPRNVEAGRVTCEYSCICEPALIQLSRLDCMMEQSTPEHWMWNALIQNEYNSYKHYIYYISAGA